MAGTSHLEQQLVVGQYLVHTAQQAGQRANLGGRQRQRLAVELHFVNDPFTAVVSNTPHLDLV